MKEFEKWLGEIMLDNLPARIRGAMRVMARLKYPINDRRSFITQLEAISKDAQNPLPEEETDALLLVR